MAAGPFTYTRVSTDDLDGSIRAYVGEGTFTDDTLETFGGWLAQRFPEPWRARVAGAFPPVLLVVFERE